MVELGWEPWYGRRSGVADEPPELISNRAALSAFVAPSCDEVYGVQ
jgi:hypothetical protein